LADAFERRWSADTAWIDDWDPENPARGQCGTTSLVVHDRFGGKLVRGLVDEHAPTPTLHYWNVINSLRVDLSWQQFPATSRIIAAGRVERTELLTDPWLTGGYERLCAQFDDDRGVVR